MLRGVLVKRPPQSCGCTALVLEMNQALMQVRRCRGLCTSGAAETHVDQALHGARAADDCVDQAMQKPSQDPNWSLKFGDISEKSSNEVDRALVNLTPKSNKRGMCRRGMCRGP